MSALALPRHESRPSLLEDNRGAVMLIGLFMACFLVGSMWFMKGIGDAIVFKDRMQEGADHVVFSSAAVHARGMNLIAVINLVMYILVVIHCILAVLKNAAAIACFFAVGCPVYAGLKTAQRIYDTAAIDIGLRGLSVVGTAAAIGYPWYGSYAGYSVGQDYKTMGVAAGPSNIPGFSFSLPLGKLFGSGKVPAGGNLNQGSLLKRSGSAATKGNQAEFSSDLKLGLPVTLAENKELCDRATEVVTSLVPGFLSWILDWIAGMVTECNGGVWEQKMFGWKKMYGPAKNGNDWMQVWSFSFPKEYTENKAESKVALGMGPKLGVPAAAAAGAQTVSPPMYFAQAEFYFDCEEGWEAEKCNGEETEASFNMRWRARMRRVAGPDFMGMILGALGDGLLGPLVDFAVDAGADALKGSKAFRDASAALAKAGRGISSGLGKQGADALGGLLDQGTEALGDAVKGKVNDALGNPNPAGASAPSVLH